MSGIFPEPWVLSKDAVKSSVWRGDLSMPLLRNSAVSMMLFIINVCFLRVSMLLTRNKGVAQSGKVQSEE